MFGDGHVQACVKVTFFFSPLKIGKGINPAAGLETCLLCHYPALQEQMLGRREKKGLRNPRAQSV